MAAQVDRQVSGNEFSGLVGRTRPSAVVRSPGLDVSDAWKESFAQRPRTHSAASENNWVGQDHYRNNQVDESFAFTKGLESRTSDAEPPLGSVRRNLQGTR